MKYQFVDIRNCQSLLPQVHRLNYAKILDKYLSQQVNIAGSEMEGSVDTLIRHNIRTLNKKRGPLRLRDSQLDIALVYEIANKDVEVRGIKRPINGKANFQTIIKYENGITWKTIVPLQFLLKGWGDANRGYHCYIHSISQNISQVQSFADMLARYESNSNDFHYVGITGRNWLQRLYEHIGEMRRGSRKKFHNAWRENLGVSDVHFISQLAGINLMYEEAMNWEEYNVEKLGLNGLNMIPGGFKGIRHLHELNIINKTDISIEEREKAIAEYARQNPRKGMPNPFVAELWKDDTFYLKIIEARPKTLTQEQVRRIRELAKLGRPVSEITEEVDALNEVQVKNVLTGRYYGRIK